MDNSDPIYYFVVNVLNITSGKQGKTLQYEPRREKTGFLHMRKQRRRSASR